MGFVADIVEGAFDAVGDVFEAVGDVVEDVGDVVGDALEYVGNTVENVIKDPLPTLLSIAGSAIGIPPPLTSAAITAARGGDLEDIVLSAGTSYVAGQSGQFVSSNVAPAISETLTSFGVEDAVLNKAITDAAGRAIVGGLTSELRGGDFEQGALSGFTGSLVSSGVKEFGGDLDPTIQRTISSGLTAAALGQDPSAAIGSSIIREGLSSPLLKQGLQAITDEPWGVNLQTYGDAEAQEGGFYGISPTYLTYEGSGDAEAQEGGFYGMPSYYESLGYSPETIKQIYEGTYSKYQQAEADAREQLGDLYDLVYPEGFPTSSSVYEGLGYDANLINQLLSGTYYGPEQTEAEVRQQMGDELFNLAYPQGYSAALYGSATMPTTGSTTGTRTTTATRSGLGGTLTSNQNNLAQDNLLGSKVSISDPQSNFLFTGQPTQQIGKDYGQIIKELASVLGTRGYKVGGSVHVPGPEGKFYEKHAQRSFAVGGPGTGQSDDIPTMLSDGEYVIDADTVAALGDGSSKAGAQVLDKFREEIRRHKRSAPTDRIPPKAKNPLVYLKSAKKSKG